MKLTIIRGLPGSGKSTYAKGIGCFHVEADMFHVRNGAYAFRSVFKHEAHEWCKDAARIALASGMDVVVSNTFTETWEIKPYIELAQVLKAEIEVIHVIGNFGSVHNVPSEVIESMRNRWQEFPNETVITQTINPSKPQGATP